MTETKTTAPEDILPVSLKLGWGTGAFGVAVLMNGVAGLIFFYMVGILKIEPAIAGTVILFTKLFDVATDPIVGLWSDRSTSPRGRRRPFLIWGALISGVSFGMIFSTPQFDAQWVTVGYITIALTIYTCGYTLFNVPYMAMPAEMTNSYHERSSIHAYRIVFVSLGGYIAAAIGPWWVEQLGKTDWSSYVYFGLVGAALITVSMLITYISTGQAHFTERTNAVSKMVEEFNAIKGNRHFLRLIGVKFAQLTGVQTTQAAMLFFILQSLELDFNILVVFGTVSVVVSIAFAPVIVAFSKRFGKREAYYLAAGANMIYALSWSFAGPGEPMWAIALRAVGSGIALTGNVVMAMSMLTDIINFDAKQTGVRREGAYVALYSFVEKFTAAIGPFVIGIALSFAGFDTDLPPDVPQGGNVRYALLLAVSWIPAIMGVIAIWLLSGYKLREDTLNPASATA